MSTLLTEVIGSVPLSAAEESRILGPTDPWSDAMAAKIAIQDFGKAETYRTQNHDWRWRVADELYLGWVQQKYWAGTKIPRASVPVFVAFEQVEALLAQEMGILFSEDPWFQVDPDLSSGTTAKEAREFQLHVLAQLEDLNIREIIRRTLKDARIYGNGICGLSWESEEIQSLQYRQRWTQDKGRPKKIWDKAWSTTIRNRPKLDHIALTDFYIDPNCPSPNIQDADYCCVRALKTIAYLDNLRKNKQFTIPPKSDLIELAKQKPAAQGDQTKAVIEQMRSGSWWPQHDQSVDPAARRIEVIARWSKDRVVWVLNRDFAILNKPNPNVDSNDEGFIPFYNAFYADVPGRFYAQGICDITEGEQRLQVSTLGNRLDELSINIHRPVQVRRGLNIPAYQLQVRPGQVVSVDTPGEDYKLTEIGEVTSQAYVEVNASEARVQKTTGLSDLIASGLPQSGGNSASRTATGIGAQVNAGGARIRYLVENDESAFLEPLLNGIMALNQLNPPIGTPIEKTVAFSKLKFFMRAGARMKSKMALMQTFPLMMQSISNPAFMAQLAQTGYTVDFAEVFRMILDMTDYQNRADLIRPLTAQEKQMMNQPPPEAVLKQQMQQQRSQTQTQIAAGKMAHDVQMKQMDLEAKNASDRTGMFTELTKALMPIAIKHALEPEKQNA